MIITPEEREVGRGNYYQAMSQYDQIGPLVNRRNFLKNVVALGGVGAAGAGALYFGYQKPKNPVRIGVIGTGDEGNVLLGAVNPDYVQVKAICDIRPSSVHRAFHGDWATDNTIYARPGLMSVYDWKSEDQARENVDVYEDYKELLKDDSIQGVVIALPLHLHAKVAYDAMLAGKHVLTEKLMAHNIAQCKIMARTAKEQRKFLATGHQRHYSILYDNAVKLIQWGLLGELHFIRAQWHRGNLPGADSWAMPIPGGEFERGSDGYTVGKKHVDVIKKQLVSMQRAFQNSKDAGYKAKLGKKIAQWEKWDMDKHVKAAKYGYESVNYNGFERSALEELVRWRIWDRTGGGLMAELGSHQLDAASIFISALGRKKARPLTVHAVGGRHIFPNTRDADDHVYCTFEFPGPGYEPGFDVGYRDKINNVPDPLSGIPAYDPVDNAGKKIVVTYSSINGNGFGGYGEVVMGTKGSLIIEREKEVLIYNHKSTSAKVGVKQDGAGPTFDTAESGDGAIAKAAESGPVSRGYREQIEHWAWCIEQDDWSNQPRCNPEVAVADAVIALTAKIAIKNGQTPGRNGFIEFDPAWFDVDSDAVPEVAVGSDSQKELTIANVKKTLEKSL